MYTDNEILFPHYAITSLQRLRGKEWAQLIEDLSQKDETSPEVLAFMSMMIGLNGCVPCETDSYRAMRGCSACAQQTMRRFKGTDEELIAKYHKALEEMRQYTSEHPDLLIQLPD
jgi:hypothetical protein